jgi:hypothetical protein
VSAEPSDLEAILRRALTPVDPPPALADRLEHTLQTLTDAAADELEGWELSAMRDPRNWLRPVAAATVGATAGTALVVLRVRGRHKGRRERLGAALDRARRSLR